MMETDGCDESLGTLTITILYLLIPTLTSYTVTSLYNFAYNIKNGKLKYQYVIIISRVINLMGELRGRNINLDKILLVFQDC